MKRFLLSVIIVGLSMFMGKAQDFPAVSYEDVESSKVYINGNAYQRDLLLYSKTFELVHPYYGDSKNAKTLRKQTRKFYKELDEVDNVKEFRCALQALTSHLNDGHSQVGNELSRELIYPIYIMFDTEDSGYLLLVDTEHKEALGKRVAMVNGKPLSDLMARGQRLLYGDNNIFKNNQLSQQLVFKDFWEMCGYDGNEVVLTLEDNTSITIFATAPNGLATEQLDMTFDSPIVLRQVPFYYEIFDSPGVCYLQFNMCYDALSHPQLGQRFDDFLEGMMAEIEDKAIKTLVVDVRNNGGGSSALCDLLLSYLTDFDQMENMGCKVRMSELLLHHQPNLAGVELNDGSKPLLGEVFDFWEVKRENDQEESHSHRINHNLERIFKGDVVFISGRNTYSSAGLLLTLARDNNIGTIIGEISGHRPSNYGDVLRFLLPNTDTRATISCRHITRPNESLNDDVELIPDVVMNLSDYTMDHDPAWEWIVNHYISIAAK